MSSTPIVNNDYKEQYLRRLHKKGYPSSLKQMVGFNKSFYNDVGLHRRKRRETVARRISGINVLIRRNIEPMFVKNKPALKKVFSAVVADCRKKYGKAVPPIRKGTPVRYRASGTTSKTSVHDDAQDEEEEEEDPAESDLEPEPLKEQLREKEQKIEDLKKEVAEQKKMVADLEKKNEEVTRNLMTKEEQLQQSKKEMERMAQMKKSEMARLGDELNLMNYQLNMVQMEAANQGQAKQTLAEEKRSLENEKRYLESTVLSMEEKNSWLEGKVRSMEGAKQALEDRVCPLEEKNRSLEDAAHSLKEALCEKDQMLKTFLKMQETIQSFTNKPAPQ